MGTAYKILVGNPEVKRPLGRHRYRWESNVITDFREIGWHIMVGIHLAQDRDQWWAHVNTVLSLLVL
jgi:hypothetical protein